MPYLDFKDINELALAHGEVLVHRLVPGGKKNGNEYVVLNPTRVDNKSGSFSINLTTGKWGDFATPHRGGDFISYTAYVLGLSTYEAAKTLAHILGVVYE